MNETVWVIDFNGNLVDVNKTTVEVLGYSKEELLTVGLYGIDSSLRKEDIIALANTMPLDKLQIFETSHTTKDGRTFPVEVYSSLVTYQGKRAILSIARDITERKRIEELLVKERQELKLIIDTSPIIVFYKDKQGRFIRVNKTFAEAQKMPAEDFVGKTVFDLYPPEIAQGMADDDQEVLESGHAKLDITEQYESAAGVRWVHTDKFPICDKNGIPFGLIGFAQDITERKKAEEALGLRMEQLVAINQASQAVATSLDLDQVLTEVMSLAGKVVGSEYTSIVLVDEAGHISRGVENMPGVLSIERRARKRGFTSWILRARQPAVADEIGEDGVIRPRVGGGAPRTANPNLVAKGIKSFVGLPLIVKEHNVGVLYLHSLLPGTFKDQLALLTTFASQAAIAIEKARLYNAVQRELAERKQAEEALQRERDTAQQYLDIAGVLMAALDTDGQITLINQKGCEILGYKESELIGRNWFDTCLSEDAREEVRGVIERLMAGDIEPVEYYENAVLTKSGAQRILAFHNAVIRNQASQITGILFSGEDITERKRAEAELQASHEAERNFAERLTILSETTTELSKAESL